MRMDQNHFVPIANATSQQQKLQQNKLMKSRCREQFFNMIEVERTGTNHESHPGDEHPIPANGLHIVSEKTKLFESGRPLSPDGSCVDRTLLYKSELSRLNQKVPTPNVALRKKEYEQIHEHSDYSRLSTDTDTIVSDSAIIASPPTVSSSQKQSAAVAVESQPPVQAVPVVVRREPKQLAEGEDERRMRRISYLRATANDTNLEINNNNLVTTTGGGSNTTINSGSAKRAAAEYAENDRAMAMNVISDNRDKRRHGRQMGDDDGEARLEAEEATKENKDEEMAVLWRGAEKRRISSASILAQHEGPMQIKITLIDGKRSHDRSWKNVWAELKGSKLNLTVQRDGKPNQVGLRRRKCAEKKKGLINRCVFISRVSAE